MGSNFDGGSGFVQFSLGVGSSDQFKRLLTSVGVPFAVLALVVLVAGALGVSCGRSTTKLASTRWFTHPSQAVWLSVAYYAVVAAAAVLLGVW